MENKSRNENKQTSTEVDGNEITATSIVRFKGPACTPITTEQFYRVDSVTIDCENTVNLTPLTHGGSVVKGIIFPVPKDRLVKANDEWLECYGAYITELIRKVK